MYIQAITKIYLHFRPFHLPSSSFHLVSTPLMLYKMENAVHCIRGGVSEKKYNREDEENKNKDSHAGIHDDFMGMWVPKGYWVFPYGTYIIGGLLSVFLLSSLLHGSACGLIIRRHNHAVQSDCPEIAARSHTTRLSSSKQSEIETMITKLALASSK